MDRWDLEDHLIYKHKFDDVSDLRDADDEELEQDHKEAHRVGQLVWEPHTHEDGN